MLSFGQNLGSSPTRRSKGGPARTEQRGETEKEPHLLDELAVHARDPPDVLHHRLEFRESALLPDPVALLDEVLRRPDRRLLGRFQRARQVQRRERPVVAHNSPRRSELAPASISGAGVHPSPPSLPRFQAQRTQRTEGSASVRKPLVHAPRSFVVQTSRHFLHRIGEPRRLAVVPHFDRVADRARQQRAQPPLARRRGEVLQRFGHLGRRSRLGEREGHNRREERSRSRRREVDQVVIPVVTRSRPTSTHYGETETTLRCEERNPRGRGSYFVARAKFSEMMPCKDCKWFEQV